VEVACTASNEDQPVQYSQSTRSKLQKVSNALNWNKIQNNEMLKTLITSKKSMYSATMYSDLGLFSQYLTYMYKRRSCNTSTAV